MQINTLLALLAILLILPAEPPLAAASDRAPAPVAPTSSGAPSSTTQRHSYTLPAKEVG